MTLKCIFKFNIHKLYDILLVLLLMFNNIIFVNMF